MDSELVQIREQQKQSWNKFSPGWKKWDQFNMGFLKPMGDAIIDRLYIQKSDHVLDIATGTGEPGLTIASLATDGKVTGTDLAEDMLAVAQEKAKAKRLYNYTTTAADVCDLPFSNDTFDAVSCRMGFMFFPDMELAASEMYRVLKPGGRLAASVWSGPLQNDWVTVIMGVIAKHITLPPPVPGAPGMFRCAAPGLVTGVLERGGFKNVAEREIAGRVVYESFEAYWTMMLEVGAPIVAAMAGSPAETINAIKAECKDLFRLKNPDGGAMLNYGAIIISSVK